VLKRLTNQHVKSTKGKTMSQQKLLAATVAAVLSLPGLALAQAASAPKSPHSFTANVGLFSQYIFRGLTQTNGDPAIQGGFDYAYDLGGPSLYLGTWASNVSWLKDGGQYTSSSLENDWYAGIKGPIGSSDFSYDAGFLYYWYPGDVVPGVGEKGDTQELYGALGWKWLTAKFSYSVSSKTFAVRDSSGTWYLDLTANYPVGETGVNLIAHWGRQKFRGTDPRNVVLGGRILSNDEQYSYDDWKLGVTYDLGKASDVLKGVTLGGFYTSSDGSVQGYGSVAEGGVYPKNLSDGTFTVFLQKTF
jgi:uncharacterized protein (TIGR02001 family)